MAFTQTPPARIYPAFPELSALSAESPWLRACAAPSLSSCAALPKDHSVNPCPLCGQHNQRGPHRAQKSNHTCPFLYTALQQSSSTQGCCCPVRRILQFVRVHRGVTGRPSPTTVRVFWDVPIYTAAPVTAVSQYSLALSPHFCKTRKYKENGVGTKRERTALPHRGLGQNKAGGQVSGILNQHPSHFIPFLSAVCSTNHAILQRTHKD